MSVVASVLGRAKLLTAATAAATAFLAFPVAAADATSATPYPEPSASGTVNTPVVGANGEVKFGGSGYVPGEKITIVVTQISTPTPSPKPKAAPASNELTPRFQLIAFSAAGSPPATPTSIKADRTGSFRASVRMTTPGTFRLTATGATSGHVVSAIVKVVGGGNGNSDGTNGNGNGGKGGLSFTGGPIDFAVTAWFGVGAIALGIAFLKLGASRRRQGLVPPSN